MKFWALIASCTGDSGDFSSRWMGGESVARVEPLYCSCITGAFWGDLGESELASKSKCSASLGVNLEHTGGGIGLHFGRVGEIKEEILK